MTDAVPPKTLRPAYAYNGGLLRGDSRRLLRKAGWNTRLGWPTSNDMVAIWGNSPTAWRGLAVARKTNSPILTVEDAFLRSVLPARMGGNASNVPAGWRKLARRASLGLLIDPVGVHFDASSPNLLENLINTEEPQETRARQGIALLRDLGLTKYCNHLPAAELPPEGCVLVVDQTAGDASLMGADRGRFLEMLAAARSENPGKVIVLRSHPETSAGLRPGHIQKDDLLAGEIFHDAPANPWQMLARASAVYTVSSQLGYEAMLAGLRPRLFGLPFYAGWGLSDDELVMPREGRWQATVEALFTASHLTGPVWYDPCRDAITDFETAAQQLAAEARAWREDHAGHLAYGMRLWKRAPLAKFFGNGAGVRFTKDPTEKPDLAWAGPWIKLSSPGHHPALVEDGFIRSRGLGAALTPPLSLITDDLGIYFDPTTPSRLEDLIAQPLSAFDKKRAEELVVRLCTADIGKYNIGGDVAAVTAAQGQKVILVPGQVADDASILLGATGEVADNAALLRAARQMNPTAFIIYKPHPDVEAGLRQGAISAEEADLIATKADPMALLRQADEVWTITSTLGFEALIRQVPVACFGAPFYAGWGLTRDLGPVPARRKARPDLPGLVHAALIAYPRYIDPVSGRPCTIEVALDRISNPTKALVPHLRLLSKLQGLLASQSHWWR